MFLQIHFLDIENIDNRTYIYIYIFIFNEYVWHRVMNYMFFILLYI